MLRGLAHLFVNGALARDNLTDREEILVRGTECLTSDTLNSWPKCRSAS
jgi:hypothetical protein